MRPADVATDKGSRSFLGSLQSKAILRLLRGEDIDFISRELGVTAATASGSRDFLARRADRAENAAARRA